MPRKAGRMDNKELKALATEAQSGGVRAAVLGVYDGLSTNIALILGVAGASPDPAIVRIAGVASLVAGAFSMAVGELISMQTQVDLLARVMGELRALMHRDPASANAELRRALERRGIDRKNARDVADELGKDPERAIGVYAGTAFGINERELGSPWIAASASLVMFATGAAVPLLPWFFFGSNEASLLSIVLGGTASFVVGAFLGAHTDGRWLRGGLRQLAFIALASAVTYGIGRLFRTHVS